MNGFVLFAVMKAKIGLDLFVQNVIVYAEDKCHIYLSSYWMEYLVLVLVRSLTRLQRMGSRDGIGRMGLRSAIRLAQRQGIKELK